MQNEEVWYADRARLRELGRDYPSYSISQLMQATGRSRSWVKKWRKRLAAVPAEDEKVLWSRSRARKTPPKALPQLIVERILHYRDHPADNLKRIPGPKTILYFLKKDKELVEAQLTPPTSTRTVWKVLVQNGRIARLRPRHHQPLERAEPYRSWQLDLKDASTVTIEPGGKKQHLVEILNTVDAGTSAWLEAMVREDFKASTILVSMEPLLKNWGLPEQVTFDRDPRFVGAHSGRDFPSAFVRFWLCLGVKVNICPPHRPDLNCYVERLHRSLGSECLAVHRPSDKAQVSEVTSLYKTHYNLERPHQGLSCNNRPPMVAFVPPAKYPLPMLINPDQWLYTIDGKRFARKVKTNGIIEVARQSYYVGTQHAGKYIAVYVDASKQEFSIRHHEKELARVAIKGLYHGRELTFEEYHGLMVEEAGHEQRQFYQVAS